MCRDAEESDDNDRELAELGVEIPLKHCCWDIRHKRLSSYFGDTPKDRQLSIMHSLFEMCVHPFVSYGAIAAIVF